MANYYFRYPGTTISGTVNVGSITGPIALPTGASTYSAQTDGTQKTRITNGTNTAAVTAASTSPAATDPALVVAISPNSQLTVAGFTFPTDMFGTEMVNSRYNQLELSFDSAPGASLITNTTSGGGSVTVSSGHTLYSTGAAASAEAKGVSVQSVTYRPGAEVYSYFTAAFTTPTSAASYQRIGIYDTNNGFFIGYEGTTFGVTLRSGAADTFTARASWNGDPLDGSAGSKFTRAGVPEAINLTYSNVFRIRFGWLGSASIVFEVLSPDEAWVVFNTIRMPNSQLNPSIQSPNLPMTLDVKKTAADATSLTIATGCWAAGASTNVQPITTTLTDNSLATLTRAVITGYSSAGGGSYNNVKVTPSGSLTVAIGDITGIVGQQTMANSIPVVIASNQSAVAVSASSLPLPTGAATSANQTTLGSQTTKINDGTNTATVKAASTAAQATDTALVVAVSPNNSVAITAASLPLPTGAATSANQTTLGSQTTKINDGTNTAAVKAASTAAGATDPALVVAVSPNNSVAVTAASLPLPTGAATSANQTTLGSQTTKINDGTNTAAVKAASTAAVATDPALVVAISPNNSIKTTRTGSTSSNAPVYNVYSSVNITTGAYVQLVASTTSATNYLDIFDSSGQGMILATGGAGAETIVAYVPPGGASYQVAISAGTRVAYKALTGNATSGYLLINFWS